MTNNNHPRAIVFDFGGVLLNWNPYHVYRPFFHGDDHAIQKFLDEIGFEEWNLEMDRGRPFADGVAELSAQFPQYAELIRAYDVHWEQSILGPIQPTVDILQSLKQAGHRLYGLSNWSYEKYLLYRPRHAFFDWFEDIVISGQVKLLKPDPQIFDLLLARNGRTAEECVFIDDSEENITAARRLGWDAIHYQSPGQLQIELQKLGLWRPNKLTAFSHE